MTPLSPELSPHPTPRIHPLASVHPDAKIGPGCVIGPYAVIDPHVVLGAGCVVGPHVYLTGHTTIGDRNQFHAGAVIGDAPQDFKYSGAPTRLRIGHGNVFREHVTVHRSAKLEEDTVIGDENFLMASCHVGHNCHLGSNNILANGVLLAGHVTLADRAFLSGNCIVHQFCRIGRLALMQGGSGISKDLPPFCIARGNNGIAGLNVIGLRRAGFNQSQRLELRQVYHALFRSRDRLRIALETARERFLQPASLELIDFTAHSKRGVCSDTGSRVSHEE